LQLVLVFLALSAAWTIRQTQGSAIFEIYQLITRPFQNTPLKQSGRMMPDPELQARLVELESQNQKPVIRLIQRHKRLLHRRSRCRAC